MDNLRVSSLPMFFECASSVLKCDYPFENNDSFVKLGTAVHEVLSKAVVNDNYSIIEIAKKYNVNIDELELLTNNGLKCWSEVSKYFENTQTEMELIGDRLKGHADIISLNTNGDIYILDWKSNFIQRDYDKQLLGYGACAVDMFGLKKGAKVIVITAWIRHGEFDVTKYSGDDIERFYHDLEVQKTKIGKSFFPGEACTFCKRQLICEARQQYISSAAKSLVSIEDKSLEPKFLVSLYEMSKVLEKALEHYKKALKMALLKGAVQDDNGNSYFIEQYTIDKLKPRVAWTLLTESGFTDDEIAESLKMSKTKILEIVSNKAERGKKAKAKMEFIEYLKDNKAIVERYGDRIKVKKVVKE